MVEQSDSVCLTDLGAYKLRCALYILKIELRYRREGFLTVRRRLPCVKSCVEVFKCLAAGIIQCGYFAADAFCLCCCILISELC